MAFRELVVDGGFELSSVSPQFLTWTQFNVVGSLGTFVSSVTVPFGITPPQAGVHSCCLICSDSGSLGPTRSIYQDLAIPYVSGLVLSFWYGLTRVFSNGLATCTIRDRGNNILATVFSQNSAVLQTPVWTQVTVPLDSFAGQIIRLVFTLTTTNPIVGNVFFSLDTISVLVPTTNNPRVFVSS